MRINIPYDLVKQINSKSSTKVLSTKDKDGIVHSVFKDSISVDDDGNIRFLEYLETSQTNKNLTYAIWYDQTVSILIRSEEDNSFQIKGIPRKVLIAGKEFEKYYREVIDEDDVLDLSGVWIIEPTEFRNENLRERAIQERKEYPIVGHMDRDIDI